MVLAFHTLLFLSFAAAMLYSPFFAMNHPEAFSLRNLGLFFIIAVGTVGSWPLFGGCPFTIWENRAWHKENRNRLYKGACIDHYVKRWLGVNLPDGLSTKMLFGLFLIPFVSAVIW